MINVKCAKFLNYELLALLVSNLSSYGTMRHGMKGQIKMILVY